MAGREWRGEGGLEREKEGEGDPLSLSFPTPPSLFPSSFSFFSSSFSSSSSSFSSSLKEKRETVFPNKYFSRYLRRSIKGVVFL